MSEKGFRKFISILAACLLLLQICTPCFAESKAAEKSEKSSAGGPAEETQETAETDDETDDDSDWSVLSNEAFTSDDSQGEKTGTHSLDDLARMKERRKVDQILEEMTLREKIGQMIFASFRWWSENPSEGSNDFTHMNSQVSRAISQDRLGGILLFSENCRDNEETLRLVQDMQDANRLTDKKNAVPLLIATDQEGGIVYRLQEGAQWTGNMAIAATGDVKNAEMTGEEIGKELSLLSINTDFGPVMDVNDNPRNPIIGVRSFSDDVKTVADYGTAWYRGLSKTGVIGTLKHFPGHGNTSTDSHTGLPRVEKTLAELNETELVPFRMGIEAGAEMIMTAHIQYPEIEKETYVSKSTGEEVFLPATMSKRILTDILRDKMNFGGVVVSDALEMQAITEHFREEDVYRMAIGAGVDMLLVPCTVSGPDSLKQLEQTIDKITDMTQKGQISEERVNESVKRILTLKADHGLLKDGFKALTDQEIRERAAGVGTEETREKEWKIMEKGLTLLKNEGKAIPFQVKSGDRILVLYPGESRVNTAEYARKRLEAEKVIPEGTRWETIVYDEEKEAECLRLAKEADHVIAVTTMFEVDEMKADFEKVLDHIIETVHKANRKIAVISAELPYDAARFQSADCLIVTYGSTRMLEPAESGKSFSVNLPAAICAAFGEFVPAGRLPVNLPALNKEYEFTNEILYPRGFSADQKKGGTSQ